MKILLKLFSRKWLLPTLIMAAGIVFLVQLGLWQLDRMDWRRDYNATVVERWNAEPFDLSSERVDDAEALEYRRVLAEGRFDYENEIVWKNQSFNGRPGVGLVTPLVLDDNTAVLVSRGWVPFDEADSEARAQYAESIDAAIVGRAHDSQPRSSEAPPLDGPQAEWFRIDVETIEAQMPYELLPFFLVQLPEGGRAIDAMPGRDAVALNPIYDLRDPSMHLSYALQWFTFALIFGFGYVMLVRLQERRAERKANGDETSGDELSSGMTSTEPLEQGL